MAVLRRWCGALALMVAFTAPAAAQETARETAPAPSGPTFGVWYDNDIFVGKDRYYTNGIQFYYLSGDQEVERAPGRWANSLLGREGVWRYGFAIGQAMYTPRDLSRRELIPDDRPYAGWLYGRFSLLGEAPRRVDRLDLDLGMVGPASLAEQTQKFVHRRVSGSTYPEGWDNQLRNEPGLILGYERIWRGERPNRLGPLEWDVTPHVAGSLGNVLTYAGAGATLRLGGNMPPPVGALVMRPSNSIPYQTGRRGDFAWYLYASTEARYVAHNIFLDGNSFVDSHSVDKNPVVGAVQLGLTLRYGSVGLTYALNFATDEFEKQKSATSYGSLRLSVQF